MAGEAALGHAWDWFALHARQRMQCVNFFLLAMAFLVAAFVTAVKDQHAIVAAAIGLLGAGVTGLFHRLEIRTKELVKAGEAAMKPLEQQLAGAVAVPALEIVHLVKDPATDGTSYGSVVDTLYRTMCKVFLLGVAYAVYQAVEGPVVVATIYRYGIVNLTADPVGLTGLGLLLGVLAGLLLAFLPPPHWSHYTRQGASEIIWTGRHTRWGAWLSNSGPVLLAASFGVQYLAWRAGAG